MRRTIKEVSVSKARSKVFNTEAWLCRRSMVIYSCMYYLIGAQVCESSSTRYHKIDVYYSKLVAKLWTCLKTFSNFNNFKPCFKFVNSIHNKIKYRNISIKPYKNKSVLLFFVNFKTFSKNENVNYKLLFYQ